AEVEEWLAASEDPVVYVSFGSFLSVRDDVLARVVEQQDVAALGEGVGAGRRSGVQGGEGGVPLGGEGVAHLLAEAAERIEVVRLRREGVRPDRREPVDLAGHREGAGVAEHDVAVGHAEGLQRHARGEGEVVDHDRVGLHLVEDHAQASGDAGRIPEQIGEPLPRLVGEGRDHPAPGGVEEAAEGRALVGRLLLRADRARVGAAPQPERDVLESEAVDDGARRVAGGHDDALARLLPRRAEGRQRQQVRRVVGADDQQGHEAPSTSGERRGRSWSAVACA
ncbi:hypothetical protein C5C26_16290, partial [Rathayibacter sp. AY2B1]